MLRKREEPKAKKSVAEALLRGMRGTTAERLALFEKLGARGGSAGEERMPTDVCGDEEVIGPQGRPHLPRGSKLNFVIVHEGE